MTANQQSEEQREAIGEAATAILALLDMGQEKEVEHIISTMDRAHLGLVITTWYQICIAYRTGRIVGPTARKTALFFKEIASEEEQQSATYSHDLLMALAENKMNRYVKLWNEIIGAGGAYSTEVAARILGFTRGMLQEQEGSDCE